MRIRTKHVYPPIPDRSHDWSAVDDDTFDGPGSKVGWGATEKAAIADLMEQIGGDPRPPCPCGCHRPGFAMIHFRACCGMPGDEFRSPTCEEIGATDAAQTPQSVPPAGLTRP